MRRRTLLCVAGVVFAFASDLRAQQLDVRLVTDEADAVLAVLAKKRANEPVTDADWTRVFSSEGYTRLKKRELASSDRSRTRSFRSLFFRTSWANVQRLSRTRWPNGNAPMSRVLLSWLWRICPPVLAFGQRSIR